MMLVVVAYDVNTESAQGRRRLRELRVCARTMGSGAKIGV